MTDYVNQYFNDYSGNITACAVHLIAIRDEYIKDSTTYNLIDGIINDIHEVECVFKEDVVLKAASLRHNSIKEFAALSARIVRDFNTRINSLIDGLLEEYTNISTIFSIQMLTNTVSNILLRYIGNFGED